MQDSNIKSDWLVNNAVVAFFGALLVAQTPRSTDSTTELIFGFSIPSIPIWWTNSAIALLLAISLILVLATFISPLQKWISQHPGLLAPTLELLMWVAFIIGFSQSLQELPKDQWWSEPLIYGGLVFMLFLPVRSIINLVKLFIGELNATQD